MRFTVHDSPDYYRMKVSVFNEDKKTELIGETFVDLGDTIVPGGGQGDSWHSLNCKGRYAGEIRIELTYYDTRAKPEKPIVEKRRESAQTTSNPSQSHSLSGPRERAPVKRRPLPSDPTSASPSPGSSREPRSLPASQAAPRSYQTPPRQASDQTSYPSRQSQYDTPQQPPMEFEDLPDPAHYDPYDPQHQVEAQYAQHQPATNRRLSAVPNLQHHSSDTQSRPYSMMDLPHSHSAPVVPQYEAQQDDRRRPIPHMSRSEEYANDMHYHSQQDYDQQQRWQNQCEQSGPPSGDEQHYDEQGYPYDPNEPPHDRWDPYHQHSSPNAHYMPPTVEDDLAPPPPPPVHRSSAPATIPTQSHPPPDRHRDMVPAPLNYSSPSLEMNRQSYSTPLHSQQSLPRHPPSGQSPSDRRYTVPRAAVDPTMSQPQPTRPISRSADIPSTLQEDPYVMHTPPQSQYHANSPAARSRPVVRVNVRSGHQRTQSALSSAQSTPRSLPSPQGTYQTPPSYHTPPRPHPLSQHEVAPPTGSSVYSSPAAPYAASSGYDTAPLIKPRAISPSPDARQSRAPERGSTTRKSISPHPPVETPSGERRKSAVPFGPDSFDEFNPSVRTTSGSTISANPPYPESPRQVLNESGEIVGFDGRVIDPSDHLPVDTYAPEPDRKGGEKSRPGRERTALSGARELGWARRDKTREVDPSIRAAVQGIGLSTSAPSTSGANPNDIPSPTSGQRQRLQKRIGGGPLRERNENPSPYTSAGFAGSGRGPMGAPPIPAKIPLAGDGGFGNEDLSALSEEMRMIDIGPSGGGGTVGRRVGGSKARFYA